MVQAVYQRFAGSCVMLMHRGEDYARYSGSAFVVHKDGYLLTAARCADPGEDLMAVPAHSGNDFGDVTMEEVAPIPVEVVRTDAQHGISLLRLVPDMEISVPDHIIGIPERAEIGATVMALGFAFGHNRLHNLVARSATLSSKIQSPSGSRLLLFDRLIQDGDLGGPLVDAHDARIIGINIARFDPIQFRPEEHHKSVSVAPSLSYAVSIEYGRALLQAEGIAVV